MQRRPEPAPRVAASFPPCSDTEFGAKLTELENSVLQTKSLMAVQPFVVFFETALAMVGGETTLEFLRNYNIHVVFLSKQLRAFDLVLKSTYGRSQEWDADFRG